MAKTLEDYRYIGQVMSQHRLIGTEVLRETDAQLTKWGVQDRPIGTGPDLRVLFATDVNLDLRTGRELEHIFRSITERKSKEGTLTYWDILLEEVFEAGGEDAAEALENELIQVAAVAISAVGSSRRARGVFV